MKKLSLLMICVFQAGLLNARAEVTYSLSGGRFGDNLVAFLHAQWVSFVFNIPLIYQPFKYSDELVLDDVYRGRTHSNKPKVYLSRSNMSINPNANVLYVLPYFPEALWEHRNDSSYSYIKVNWDNEEFYNLICSLIKPKNHERTLTTLPEGKISVAVHIRKGGGFDEALFVDTPHPRKPYLNYYADYRALLKFPPEGFFAEQIKKISEMYNHCALYVYIFTDDRNPALIAQKVKNMLQGYDNIEIDYRKSGNFHDSNVLDDFFEMMRYDCLIRPESNYSLVVGKIKRPHIEMYPSAGHWIDTQWFIDKVEIINTRSFNNDKQYIPYRKMS